LRSLLAIARALEARSGDAAHVARRIEALLLRCDEHGRGPADSAAALRQIVSALEHALA
jgi:hypothetical protein